MAPLLTTAVPLWPMPHTTIILQVHFLLFYQCSTCSSFPICLENFIFVDHECLNGHATSTASDVTHRHYTFRQDIKIRDGQFCIVTQEPAAYCDEVHLIPRCKGDEVILLFYSCISLTMFFELLSSTSQGSLKIVVPVMNPLHCHLSRASMISRMEC